MPTDPSAVIEAARREFHEEQNRAAIERIKARMRRTQARPWWHRLFPFVITITRRAP